MRSPIWALFTGISTLDTYRIEVVVTYEFIPSMTFEPWSPVEPSRLDSTAVREMAHMLGGQLT